jgi:hypothetical protein
MKTKTYKFEVTIETPEKTSGFLQSLKNEVESEAAQLMLTKKINKESSIAHDLMLKEFMESIYNELGDEIIANTIYTKSKTEVNCYIFNSAKITLVNGDYLNVKADPDRADFNESKYTTFHKGVYFTDTSGFRYDSVEHFLQRNRGVIKNCIK